MISIGEDVFVTENLNGASNAGVVIGKRGIIVVDSTFFPSKAIRLMDFISSISSKVVLYVVNTHYHLDHTLGNCSIEAPVISSKMTKDYLERIDFEKFRSSLEPIIQRELKNAHIVFPSITFNKKMTVDLGNKKVEILRVGGHTPDSSIVKVWPNGICFCGDLLFSGYHAEITSESDIDSWIKVLGKLKNESLKWFVPGHGMVGGVKDVDEMIIYLEKFKSLSFMIKSNKIDDVIEKFGDDPVFAKRGFPLLFEDSLIEYLRRDDVGKNAGPYKTRRR